MLMKDEYNDKSVAKVLGPVVLSSDSTPSAIDLQGFRGALVQIGVGIGGITFDSSNKIEFVLTHSDDDSTYSNVEDADMLGVTGISSGIIKSLVAAHAAAANYLYGYIGGKRYLKLKADFTGTHGTGTPLDLNIIRSCATLVPIV